MCKGMGLAAFLWQDPTTPLALPLGPSSQLVLALGTVADTWPYSGS